MLHSTHVNTCIELHGVSPRVQSYIISLYDYEIKSVSLSTSLQGHMCTPLLDRTSTQPRADQTAKGVRITQVTCMRSRHERGVLSKDGWHGARSAQAAPRKQDFLRGGRVALSWPNTIVCGAKPVASLQAARLSLVVGPMCTDTGRLCGAAVGISAVQHRPVHQIQADLFQNR